MEAGRTDAPSPGLVLAVVVAYRCPWSGLASTAFLTGRQAAAAGELQLAEILVYDNSPETTARPPMETPSVSYKHDATNGGTRAAYVEALRRALAGGQEWILLLDQDTALPADYLSRATAAARTGADILVPVVMHGSDVVSPATVTWTGRIVPAADAHRTMQTAHVTAIASGLMIRTGRLAELFPPPPALWLDYLDHWLLARGRAAGIRPALIDVALSHHLSISDIDYVSATRLRSVWEGERLFMRCLPAPARILYPLRIALRLIRLTLSHRAAAAELRQWLRTCKRA